MSDKSCPSAAVLLGNRGPFADNKPGFQEREEQLKLTSAIEGCIRTDKGVLMAEAGTGVGKTFAYLVPVIASGKKAIISTGTKHLQDQLFLTDLPAARKVLRSEAKVALLKGRANYLCHTRLQQALSNSALQQAPKIARDLQIIRQWANYTKTGEISELTDVPEHSPAWEHVTSTEAVCGSHATDEEKEGCCVTAARERAAEADIVVVNHHLLCADLSLKDKSLGEILPDVDSIIIDEAHNLPETAAIFFGHRISSRAMFDLSNNCHAEYATEVPDMKEIPHYADQLVRATNEIRSLMGAPKQRQSWSELKDTNAADGVRSLLHILRDLHKALTPADGRSTGIDSCIRQCDSMIEDLEKYLDLKEDHYIRWYETFHRGFALNLTPENVADEFTRVRDALDSNWVFTSATLSVNGEFDHFKNQLGIKRCATLQVDSPFDYKNNALMYLPADMPEPNTEQYDDAVLRVIEQTVNSSQGRCFALFTSYRALEKAATQLRATCRYPVLVQGQMSKRDMIETFLSHGNAVLLGTSSFWEGVDVQGDALSCVIINKLPFASPSDPVLQARIDGLKKRGGNPFFDIQLPKAVLTMKQGVGRLIRSVDDKGVLVICDPRLRTKVYGKTFIDSLPPMRKVQRESTVDKFFKKFRKPELRLVTEAG